IDHAATSARQIVEIIQDWINKHQELLTHIQNAIAAFLGAQGLIAVWGLLQTTIAAIQAAGTSASLGISAVTTALKAALTPANALGLALFSIIEAYQSIQKFQGEFQAAYQGAQSALGGKIQSGEITKSQYDTANFNAQTQAFG